MKNLTRDNDGMLTYKYSIGSEVGFTFHTLAEVGEPYQQWFRDKIAKKGWLVLYGRSLTGSPGLLILLWS